MVQNLSAGDHNQLSQEKSHKGLNNPQESNYPTDTVQVLSSNYVTERQKTIDWLLENKYPPIPVAPAIDPYKYHLLSKEKKTGVKYCPLTSDLKPVPPPKTKEQKAWLIPSKYFDPPPDGADWGCDQNQEDVTNCDQNLVTGKNDGKSSASTSDDDDVTIVTKKEEEEEEGGLEKNPLPNFEGDTEKKSSSPKKVDFSPEKMVTTVTKSKTTERQAVQPVTNSENNWSHPVTLVTGCNQDSGGEHRVSQPPMDWNELVEGMDEEMKRLDWSVDDGVAYLLHKYNKKSRQLLTDGEALEFYEFLKNRKSKYVVGERVIVTHTSPEFNGQIAEVVSGFE